MKRITLDWDSKNKYDLSSRMRNIFLVVKDIEKIEIKKSTSKGYHVIIWTNKDYTENYTYRIRMDLYDDIRRVINDKYRIVGKNTLFNKKKRKKFKK